MPDSFTKFKEEEPKASVESDGGSTDEDEEEIEDVSDVVYTIDSIFIFQESGDTVFFEMANADDFRVGDTINASDDIIGIGGMNDIGTIQGIYDSTDGEEERYILAVTLDGTSVIGPSTYLSFGKFVDNCIAGYGQCAAGSTGAGVIDSEVIFFIKSSTVPVGTYNFQKAITVTGTSGSGFSTANLEFDYTFSQNVVGLGIAENGSGVQTDDRLVSPFGPFLPNSSLNFTGEPALTITVSVADGFYGSQLNSEETSTVDFLASTEIPGTELDSSEAVAMTYPLLDAQRIAIKVENISGFSVGQNILSCRLNSIASCTEASGHVEGKAQIEAINSSLGVIYASVLGYDSGSDNSEFPSSNYIMNASNATIQESDVQVIFSTADTAITLQPVWKNNGVTVAEPANTTYSISLGTPVTGLTFTSGNGYISINSPELVIGKEIEVEALDTSTNEIIGNFTFSFNAIGSPTSIKIVKDSVNYAANPGSPYVHKVGIDSSDSLSLDSNIPTDFPDAGDSTDFGLAYIYYSIDAALPSGGVFTNSSSTDKVASINYTPSQYNDGSVTYTVSGFHPALTGSVAFDTLELQFKSATSFETIYYPQAYNSGTPANSDKLILEVSDVAPFKVGDTISNNGNTNAVVTFINVSSRRLFVRITSAPTEVADQFKVDDDLDKTSSYVTSRATISDIIHVFDAADVSLSKTPVLYDSLGNVQSLDTANSEALVWTVTPDLPAELSLKTDGTISLDPSITPVPTSLTVLTETEFRVQARSSIDTNVQVDYKFALVKSPSLASLARYQIIRLSSNANRFYRGTRISTPPVASEVVPSGRVLMTIDADENGSVDSLLIEGNGDFANNMGVDNTPSYFANEATVVPYIFLYVKDSTDFSVSSSLNSSSGATATIVDKNDDSNVLYVKVNSGTFAVGDSLSGDGNTTIDNILDRHYITDVFLLTTNTNNFDIGEEFTGATAGDQGIVVAKDGNYLFVRHLGGTFSQGEIITDSNGSTTRTIDKIVGPNITINTNVGGGNIQNSSNTYASTTAEDFYEGQALTCYTSASAYLTSGFAVAGTDYLNGKVVMQIEDFGSHCEFASNYYIDDISSGSVSSNSGASDANDITSIDSSNLMIGYVSDLFYLDAFVKGEVSSATISPEVLPDGLTFDGDTGSISGIPTSPMTGESYTVTFRSSDGQEIAYTFDLVIYNQFEISQKTENASSLHMHREGQGYAASYCRVISPQVIDDISDNRYNDDIYGFNDVICRLEGGEGDFYNNGIEFEITAGAGMCEYVSYTPYSYKPYLGGNSVRTIVEYDSFSDATSCGTGASGTGTAEIGGSAIDDGYVTVAGLSGGNATASRSFGADYCDSGDCVTNAETTDVCKYDYSQYNENWPNLDEGEITVISVSCEYEELDDGAGNVDTECDCTYTETVTECGGDATENISGAKMSSTLDPSEGSIVINAFAGINDSQVIDSPISLQTNNKYLANYIALEDYGNANGCYANNYHMEEYSTPGVVSTHRADWSGYTSATDPLGNSSEVNPLSKFYTFSCLDAAYNNKATITVQVRDWDNEFSPEDPELEMLVNSTKMDSNSSSFDNIFDLDSFWQWSGATLTTPSYGTCGSTATSTVGVGSINIVAGENEATVTGIAANEAFPAGSVIQLSSGQRFLLGTSVYGDGTVELATTPESNYNTTFSVIRKIPFPLK